MTAGEARFGSAAEEAAHYKAQVRSMQDALQEAENGLQEFMESSKELEAELEADIAQSTARADELQAENESLRLDVDEWRVRGVADAGKVPAVALRAQCDARRAAPRAVQAAGIARRVQDQAARHGARQ